VRERSASQISPKNRAQFPRGPPAFSNQRRAPPALPQLMRARLIVWCKACGHQVEPDPAEHARRYGPATVLPDWRKRLVCSACGSHDIDMVVTGTVRQPREG
jgi:hypothetical protein